MAKRQKQANQPKTAVLIGEPLTMNGLEGWLWDAACSIRGAVDAPKFKDYILPLIFVKRLSDVFEDEIDRLAEKFGDRKTALELVEEDYSLVRFYLPPEASWAEVRKLTHNVGQRLTDVCRAIAKTNPSLQGVIDVVDFNAQISGQRIIEDARLSTLIEILSRHRLGLKDVEPDIFGRAYEYLLRKFAEGQGQSAGEFFTPKEVGWLIARLLRPEEGMAVYDPACGSAGLLIKAQLLVQERVRDVKRPLRLYGQERIHTTFAIARMNMIIHDMEGEIAIGDTLLNPKFLDDSRLRTFDLVAANPMWNQDGYTSEFVESDAYGRFALGYPPASTADWGWAQHMLASLNDFGRAVIVLDTGAVSRGSGQSSNRERDIRKAFVEKDLVEAVVLLPENLFYNNTSPGILLCLNRNKPTERRDRILLINASAEFAKGKPKNFLTAGGTEKIGDVFLSGEEVPHFSRVITREEATSNDYNLIPSRYVSTHTGSTATPFEIARANLLAAQADRLRADEELRQIMEGLVSGADSAALGVRLKDSEIGPVPEHWEVVPLRDVTLRTELRDPRKTPEGIIEYVDVSAVSNEALRIDSSATYRGSQAPSRARKVMRAGDVIFATIRPYLRRVAMVPENLDNQICSTAFCVVRVNPARADPVFIFHVMTNDGFVSRVANHQHGTSYPAVSDRVVLDQLIPLPPLAEQREIAKALATLRSAVEADEHHRQALGVLLTDLLAHVMNGSVHLSVSEPIHG